MLLKSSVKEGGLESCGGLSWEDPLEKPEDWSEFEPDTQEEVCVVSGVTDVLASPPSVVTEFCDGFSYCSDWEYVEPESFFLSPKSVHIVAQLRRKR